MEFNVSTELKKQLAEHALELLQTTLYRDLLMLGVNPEEFDYESISESTDPTVTDTYRQVTNTYQKIENIKTLINSLV